MSEGFEDDAIAHRRAFLAKCGRFAAVTPPVITLMLGVSGKADAAAVATSGKTTATTSTSTLSFSTVTVTTSTTTVSDMGEPSEQPSQANALLVDGMSLMKTV